jgi:hypothetical protein
MAPDVSIVTVTFGDRLAGVRVGTGLDAVQRTGGDPLMEVIVVAVGPEGRAAAEEMVEHAAPAGLKPEILEIETDAPYARAANTGAAKASGDILVVANPAVTFHQRFLRRLRTEADEEWDFLAPAVREGEDGKVHAGATRRGRTHRLAPVPDLPKQPARVSAGHGACVILRRSTLERRIADAGHLFEEAYEEANAGLDLFWWAERQGLIVRYVPTLYVGHAVGQELLPSAEERQRSMASYRVTVWRHADEPRDWVGWVLGEAAFVSEEFTIGQLSGVARYLGSWRDSVRAAQVARRSGGRLRERSRSQRP